jgi:SlyX protein
MTDHEALATRVAELEVRLTLQQDELEKLSEVLWRQQRELDGLTKRLATLEARRAAASEGAGAGEGPPPDDEVPPHY